MFSLIYCDLFIRQYSTALCGYISAFVVWLGQPTLNDIFGKFHGTSNQKSKSKCVVFFFEPKEVVFIA